MERDRTTRAAWLRLTRSPFFLGPRALAVPLFVFVPPPLTSVCSSLPLTSSDSGPSSRCASHLEYTGPLGCLLASSSSFVRTPLKSYSSREASALPAQGPSSCVRCSTPARAAPMSVPTVSSSIRFVCSCAWRARSRYAMTPCRSKRKSLELSLACVLRCG